MTARETLAAAHERMTADEIAAHALVLAEYIEQQAGLIRSQEGLVTVMAKTITELTTHVGIIQTSIRIALAQLGRGLVLSGLEGLAKLSEAEITIDPEPVVFPVHELPRDLFDPTFHRSLN